MEELAPLLWIVAIALIFWLLIIRPAKRRQNEIAQVQASIAPGETVVLTSGIFGTVASTDDGFLTVEIAPGVVVKVARGAVGSVVRTDGSAEPDTADAADTADADGIDAVDAGRADADEESVTVEDASDPRSDADNEER